MEFATLQDVATATGLHGFQEARQILAEVYQQQLDRRAKRFKSNRQQKTSHSSCKSTIWAALSD